MSGWLGLTQLGLSPNQKHQALLGAPKIVHCGETLVEKNRTKFGEYRILRDRLSNADVVCLFCFAFSDCL